MISRDAGTNPQQPSVTTDDTNVNYFHLVTFTSGLWSFTKSSWFVINTLKKEQKILFTSTLKKPENLLNCVILFYWQSANRETKRNEISTWKLRNAKKATEVDVSKTKNELKAEENSIVGNRNGVCPSAARESTILVSFFLRKTKTYIFILSLSIDKNPINHEAIWYKQRVWLEPRCSDEQLLSQGKLVQSACFLLKNWSLLQCLPEMPVPLYCHLLDRKILSDRWRRFTAEPCL